MSKFDQPFTYYEAPSISSRFQKGLEEIGGKTVCGKPKLRVVWGMDELREVYEQTVPRYVNSKCLVRTEEKSEAGLILGVKEEMQFFGTPRWIIEEWHPVETWGVSAEQAERDWEANRWEFGIGPVADGSGGSIIGVIKKARYGEFPRGGRYEYMCKLETDDGEYAHPSEFWLNVIRETYHRRNNRRFVSIEAEINDLGEQIQARKQQVSDRFIDEVSDELSIHAHRLTDPARVNKGGQRADRIILCSR